MTHRYLGIDIGAEALKVVELARSAAGFTCTRRALVEHRKEPVPRLLDVLEDLDWQSARGAAVTGRFGRAINLPHVPLQQALSRGAQFLFREAPLTLVSIGSHGFAVLERRESGAEVFRENSRCSQGTGNFLRQLVERFDLSIEAASQLCEDVTEPAPLSGRCPVILKTDMTHLANKGESRARILAGLYDAVAENVQVLIKPRVSPPAVALIGGVSRSQRIRAHFARFLARHDMTLLDSDESALFCEAIGAALEATERPATLPALEALTAAPRQATFERLPALATTLPRVQRLPAEPIGPVAGTAHRLILGFDIGSTGSKAVAIDAATHRVVWQGYRNTNGQPVAAAQALLQQFLDEPAGAFPVCALGATGSGREIVGSLMATCYGPSRAFVLNEIAAHATGALHHDPRVDTIFEIGGQDAKYIRLAEGRVVDAAMNEACSAGTGSFIEEQGRRFAGIENVVHLAEEAVRSDGGISLGQHCSVFMAEIIDAAVAAGAEQRPIIAGIYESVVQNYLNRVKGSRSIGSVVFCQGMPFAAAALGAAVARQTGSEVVIPPHPGTVGALGIALLAGRELVLDGQPPLDLARFLHAQVESKESFVCQSTHGCGGAGNKCRIDRLRTIVDDQRQRFTWGGACSLHDKGTGKRKLPDRAPDPFREREALVAELVQRLGSARGRPTVALTDEFVLKGLLPFFATFLSELGFDLRLRTGADQRALKRGIEAANVPFCAPMQQFHGLVADMADAAPDYLFLPMLRSLPRSGTEAHAAACPIAQGGPDILRWDLPPAARARIVSPVIDVGTGNLDSQEFQDSCARLAAELGIRGQRWRAAWRSGVAAQRDFDRACAALGEQALAFCAEHDVVPVVVLGRPYTVYNTVLNSNVPAILREQGVLPIPVDCYPLDDRNPVFDDIYWGHGQRNLRAAYQIRRTPGVYSLFCSNYSCGPDSFVLHFYAYLMAGKPFSVIETDGHSGDAGTKTRVEAFLYCVREDLAGQRPAAPAAELQQFAGQNASLAAFRARGDTLLLPYLTDASRAVEAMLRGLGVTVESLGVPDRDALEMGRRHTSGKECVPLQLTLGRVLQRIQQDPDPTRRFVVLMPKTTGPCRFGLYNLLEKVVLERLGLGDRVRMWSPVDAEYFSEVGPGPGALAVAAIVTQDMLSQGLYDVRPVESRAGAAQSIYDRYAAELWGLLEAQARAGVSKGRAILEAASGRLFGCTALLERAAAELAAIKGARSIPTVAVVGEIYVRCDPFACDYVVDKLEARGLRARFAGVGEWLEYIADLGLMRADGFALGTRVSHLVQRQCHERTWSIMARALGWPARTSAGAAVTAATEYLRPSLEGEAVLTIGGPLAEWRHGHIDGVVSVGPLECMPNKLAEAQFFHISEREGLPSLTVPLHGDPMDPDTLDHFAYEVHRRFGQSAHAGGPEIN